MDATIRRILVPVDFSEHSKKALKYSVDFARIFNSSILLVYVIEPVIYPADFSMGQVAVPSMEMDINARANEELLNLAQREIPSDISFETIVKTGKPFVEIIETAAEKSIDLIIIATHGHSGMEQILFGSTAEKVVRKAPCPVLTLRSPIKGFKLQ